jgi:hypothetical protein
VPDDANVAVARRACGLLGADDPVCACTVLDDDGLAPAFGQLLTDTHACFPVSDVIAMPQSFRDQGVAPTLENPPYEKPRDAAIGAHDYTGLALTGDAL